MAFAGAASSDSIKPRGISEMGSEEDAVTQQRVIDARARNISHNVRCTECGSQSIEDSQADIAILLRKLIRDEIRSGKSDQEIFKKLEDEYGETVLYAPKFDMQTAALWLSPFLVAGAAGGIWAYTKHRQRTNVEIMAWNLVKGHSMTLKEEDTMMDLLTPPPPEVNPNSWWRRWLG
ncbi:hypothetical protein QQ045_009001 [Rhodiola kirilowii]